MPSYSGNPTGEGNPPGKHSPSYTKSMTSSSENFVNSPEYRGSMDVGRNQKTKSNDQRPTSRSNSTLESRANKENPLP